MEAISSSAKAESQELFSRLASNSPPASQPRQGVIDAKRRLQEKREAPAARRAQAANGNGGGNNANNAGGNGGGGGNAGGAANQPAADDGSRDLRYGLIWVGVALALMIFGVIGNYVLGEMSLALQAESIKNGDAQADVDAKVLTLDERRDALKNRGNGKVQQQPQSREAFIATRIQAMIDRCGQKANPAITYELEAGCHFFKVEGSQAARFTVSSSHRVYTIERAGNGTPVVITAANGSSCEDSEAKSCSEWVQGNFRSGENLGIVAKPGGGFILNIARR